MKGLSGRTDVPRVQSSDNPCDWQRTSSSVRRPNRKKELDLD